MRSIIIALIYVGFATAKPINKGSLDGGLEAGKILKKT